MREIICQGHDITEAVHRFIPEMKALDSLAGSFRFHNCYETSLFVFMTVFGNAVITERDDELLLFASLVFFRKNNRELLEDVPWGGFAGYLSDAINYFNKQSLIVLREFFLQEFMMDDDPEVREIIHEYSKGDESLTEQNFAKVNERNYRIVKVLEPDFDFDEWFLTS